MLKLKDFFINDEGIYSTSRPIEALQISKWIFEESGQNHDILELCSGIGGDTINLSNYFKNVYTIEYNKDTYNLLLKNIKKFNKTNIITYNINLLQIFDQEYKHLLKTCSVVYIDLPWNGRSYKLKKDLELYAEFLGLYVDLDNIMNKIFSENKDIIIFVKAPFNVKIDKLYKNTIIIKNKLGKPSFQILKFIKN